MKLFSSDRYTKPGKGVDKNAKPKPGFIRFFIVLANKFNKLAGINFINFLFGIPAFIIVALLFGGAVALYDVFDQSVNLSEMIAVQGSIQSEFYFRMMMLTSMFLTCIPIFAFGPAYAGFTYILKSFYKEEPVFLWHDFRTKARTNRSLAVKTMIFNFVCGTMIIFAFVAYMVIANPNNPRYAGSVPFVILFFIALVDIFFLVLLIMMNLFMYPMMVTFNLSFKQMLRNTFVLCMIRWLPALGIIILDLILIGVPVLLLPTQNYIVFVFGLIIYAWFLPAFIGLINMFFVYPIFKKFLIDNPNADKSEKLGEEEEPVIEEKKPAGRFENGMWISYGDENPPEDTAKGETEETNQSVADTLNTKDEIGD
ncbi:MAG: hypothetical protein K6B54_06360 [Clostridia bacterium]|nr:hypothetical protein [Clostridia bacterium]